MFKFSNNFNIINFEYKNIYILPFNFNSANNNKIINNLANNINRSSYKAVRTYCASKRTTPNNKSFEDIPGPWPSLPLIGTGWQYMKFFGRYQLNKLHEANQNKHLKYGNILKEEYQWKKPIIHLFNPNDFEIVFRNQGKYPIRPPNEFVCHYRRNNHDKYPNVGLAHMSGEEWYKQRMMLTPALMKLDVIKNHIPAQNDICDDLVNYLLKNKDPKTNIISDLQDATYRHALESICMMCLDSRMGCLSTSTSPTPDGNQLISATKLLFESYNELYYGLPIWKFYPTKSYRKLDEAESIIYETASKYVEIAVSRLKRKSQLSINELTSGQTSVLETLLKIQGVTEADIKITIIDFIAGGIFTVSNALSLLFYHLAKNIDCQHKLYMELRHVMDDDNNVDRDANADVDAGNHNSWCVMTAEKLSKLQYLKACIKECFRLSSPVPGIMRILSNCVSLSGYQVPAGTIIFSHFMIASRLPEYFNDPLSFQPERWLGESRKQIHPFVSLPFGYGNRMCVGRRFSELELYMATAKVVYNFELELVTEQIDFKHAFIIIPGHPIAIKFNPRKHS